MCEHDVAYFYATKLARASHLLTQFHSQIYHYSCCNSHWPIKRPFIEHNQAMCMCQWWGGLCEFWKVYWAIPTSYTINKGEVGFLSIPYQPIDSFISNLYHLCVLQPEMAMYLCPLIVINENQLWGIWNGIQTMRVSVQYCDSHKSLFYWGLSMVEASYNINPSASVSTSTSNTRFKPEVVWQKSVFDFQTSVVSLLG